MGSVCPRRTYSVVSSRLRPYPLNGDGDFFTLHDMILRTSKTQPHPLLGIIASEDPVLRQIAPVGLAAARGTCLIVDADPAARPYSGAPRLEEMVDRGLRLSELVPERKGVAIVSARSMPFDDLLDHADALARFWPGIVIRTGTSRARIPNVPVVALLPPPLDERSDGPAIYQTCRRGAKVPTPGLGLPPLGRSRIRSLLAGIVEPRWGWVRAFRSAWELPWV